MLSDTFELIILILKGPGLIILTFFLFYWGTPRIISLPSKIDQLCLKREIKEMAKDTMERDEKNGVKQGELDFYIKKIESGDIWKN